MRQPDVIGFEKRIGARSACPLPAGLGLRLFERNLGPGGGAWGSQKDIPILVKKLDQQIRFE